MPEKAETHSQTADQTGRRRHGKETRTRDAKRKRKEENQRRQSMGSFVAGNVRWAASGARATAVALAVEGPREKGK